MERLQMRSAASGSESSLARREFGMPNSECEFLKWPLFLIFCIVLTFLGGQAGLSASQGIEDPMEGREAKLKSFREKRDRFFKEDPQSPLKDVDRKRFKGLLYYPINLKYCMVGTIERYPTGPKPLYINLPTNKGKDKKYVKWGKSKFKWEGKEYVLQVYRPLGGGELFLPFKDKTSGKETYSDGRYLHIEPMPGGKVLVDFNRAYSPFCQYNEKYSCPFAPLENCLEIPIQAGEKRFR